MPVAYDIVILPPAVLDKKISKGLLKASKGVPAVFVVDGKALHLHMSLFHIRMQSTKFRELVFKVNKVVKKYKPFVVESKKFSFHPSGFFSLEFFRNRTWEKMEQDIVEVAANLRSGEVSWDSNREPSPLESKLRRLYGSSYLYPLTKPHFTLGMTKNISEARLIAKRFGPWKFKFMANMVAITQVNKHNQVIKVLKIIKFG